MVSSIQENLVDNRLVTQIFKWKANPSDPIDSPSSSLADGWLTFIFNWKASTSAYAPNLPIPNPSSRLVTALLISLPS